ncbi:MAG TPA: glycine betaine ABC transporter substrate-binding protein [Gemmatimonadaceae bacterium]|nr:glycine betaine ABC transporter substrate-binding protein [Gemmatimonadaceae bacterium]
MKKFFLSFFAASALGAQNAPARPVVIASKPFGESYLLAEMFAQVLESRGMPVTRRFGFGATEVAFGALRSNSIDVYPEYTGTGLIAILHDSLPDSIARDPLRVYAHVSREFSRRWGMRWLPPLGFENTYAIAVRQETAAKYNLKTLTDLARAGPNLNAGLTADFIGRPDGLAGLRKAYDLTFKSVRSLSPALKYQALAQGGVDVVDGYSTDGLLAKYDLVVLLDDKRFFPPYQAAALAGDRLAVTNPRAIAALSLLSGKLDERTMRGLNQRVEVNHEDAASVAKSALSALGLIDTPDGAGSTESTSSRAGFLQYLLDHRSNIIDQTLRHLLLSALALLAAIVIGIPLGLALERRRHAAEGTLAVLGVIETIPSIALLAFMLPLFGVGVAPALTALWLYALYPVVRATYTGVREADPDAVEAAEALGTTPSQRLLWIRLPLATPVIMSGVRTAAVIIVGAATLAAFIGAGGLGEPIVQGLALADTRLVLTGAIPAAILAVLVDRILAIGERILRPPHLRTKRS